MAIDQEINLRSEEVQEILGTPPGWIIRWGITIMLLVVVVLLIGSYLYRFPDIIPARVTILSVNPPVQIVAKSDGKIESLFVKDNQPVEQGGILAVIESSVTFKDAYSLLERLDSIQPVFKVPERFKEVHFSEQYSLGQYQSYLSSFVSQLRSYQTYLHYNPYNQRITSLKKQLADYDTYYKRSEEQGDVLLQDYELALKQFRRDSSLFVQNIMAEVEFEASKAEMLKQKYSWQNAMTGLANTRITMNSLDQQIQEQEVLKSEAGNQHLALLKERYDNLVNQLISWEQTNILKTPINGVTTFTNFWSENQFVRSGEVVFTVVPHDGQRIVGRAAVPVAGAGKVAEGQRVNIKLDNYPHMEFGIVEGKITNISKVPVTSGSGSFYTAEIALINQLSTNYQQELPFNQEMQGVAEIITKERRLLERIVEPLISVIRENF